MAGSRQGGGRKCLLESAFYRIYVDKDGGFSVTEQESCAGLGRGGVHPANAFFKAFRKMEERHPAEVRAPAGDGGMVFGVWQHLKSNNGG
jgi:hypothetical protein